MKQAHFSNNNRGEFSSTDNQCKDYKQIFFSFHFSATPLKNVKTVVQVWG